MITIKELRDLIEGSFAARFPDNNFSVKNFSREFAFTVEFWRIRKEGVKFCSISAEKEQSSYIYKIAAFLDWFAREIVAKDISNQFFIFVLHRATKSIDIYSRNNYAIGSAYATYLANCALN